MGNYSIREWFFKAEKSYLESYIRIRSWSMVKRLTLAKKIKILDYRWVYVTTRATSVVERRKE